METFFEKTKHIYSVEYFDKGKWFRSSLRLKFNLKGFQNKFDCLQDCYDFYKDLSGKHARMFRIVEIKTSERVCLITENEFDLENQIREDKKS